MTQRKALYGSTAVFIALAGMAQADVTARQVWDNITNFYGAAGYEITPGAIDEAGGTLTVSDLKMSFPNPYADLQQELAIDASATLPMLKLEEQGDGTVAMSISDVYTFAIVLTPPGEETGTINFSVDQTGMSLVASGSPDKVTYNVSGPSVAMKLDSIEVPGEEEIRNAFQATIAANNYSGTYVLGSGATPAMNMGFSAEDASMVICGKEPGGGEDGGRFDANVMMQALNWSSSGVFAQGNKPGDLTSMLRAGMTSAGDLSHGGSTYMVDFKDRWDAFAMNGSSGSGSLVFDMSDQGISYSVSNTDMALTVSGSEIPLPEVALSAMATKFGITMPVLASDAAQDIGMSLRLEGFSVSDMIWGMMDPSGQLPRDPANIILELAGKANWFIDIMDPMSMAEADVEMPGAVEAMDITELKLSLAGAELTGAGAFTFDMNNMSPAFGGLPAPTGALDLQLVGGNGLMDKLVGMGLLPQEQAMGARMMMGLFAVPNGDDSLTSKIEVDGATGAVSANGQRLQ